MFTMLSLLCTCFLSLTVAEILFKDQTDQGPSFVRIDTTEFCQILAGNLNGDTDAEQTNALTDAYAEHNCNDTTSILAGGNSTAASKIPPFVIVALKKFIMYIGRELLKLVWEQLKKIKLEDVPGILRNILAQLKGEQKTYANRVVVPYALIRRALITFVTYANSGQFGRFVLNIVRSLWEALKRRFFFLRWLPSFKVNPAEPNAEHASKLSKHDNWYEDVSDSDITSHIDKFFIALRDASKKCRRRV